MILSRLSLHQLLLWTGAGALLVLFVPMALYLAHTVSVSADRSLAARGESLGAALGGQLVEPMLTGNRLALADALDRARAGAAGVRYLCLADADGRVVAHTFAGGYPVSLAELWRRRGAGTWRLRAGAEPLLNVSVPVLAGQLGFLHVGMSRREAAETGRRLRRRLGAALAAALAVFLAGAQVISARVSRPLRRLEEHVRRIPAESSPAGFARLRGTREVVSLSHGFAAMARRLAALEREREATRERMVHAERLAALGELAAGLAHEVNNPLDGMLEALRFLDADPDRSARAAKYYPMLREGLERIARVMQGMLVFARSGQDVTIERCAVAELVAALRLLVEAHLRGRHVQLAWTGPQRCVCFCDRQAAVQAALNLIRNAADAAESSPRPEVRVETGCDGQWVFLAVEDSGPGVPAELRRRIFEPFFTTKGPGRGTGLGLSISRQLVRASGGELELAEEPGTRGGARFVIRLPRDPSAECDDDDTDAGEHPDR